jgi:hypothetical protein
VQQLGVKHFVRRFDQFVHRSAYSPTISWRESYWLPEAVKPVKKFPIVTKFRCSLLWALVNAVLNIRDPPAGGNFSARWTTVRFWRRILLLGVDVVTVDKRQKVGWERNVAVLWWTRNEYTILWGYIVGNMHLKEKERDGTVTYRWESGGEYWSIIVDSGVLCYQSGCLTIIRDKWVTVTP